MPPPYTRTHSFTPSLQPLWPCTVRGVLGLPPLGFPCHVLWRDISVERHCLSTAPCAAPPGQLSTGPPQPTTPIPGWREGNLCPVSPSPTGWAPPFLLALPGGESLLLPLMVPPLSAPSSRVWLGLCLPHNYHRHCEALLLGVLPPTPALPLPQGEEEEADWARSDPPGLVLLVHPQAQHPGRGGGKGQAAAGHGAGGTSP